MTTVSIALCTYNGERFLDAQLTSLAQQSHRPDEIVICDDDSSDGTLGIIQTFANTAPFKVRVFRNPRNLGYVKNFEKAVSLCQGDMIFMCDQDDVWHPEKIEICLGALDAEQTVGLVLHDFNWIDADSRPYPGPVGDYGTEGLGAEALPECFRRESIEIFMKPYPRAWCGCMMVFRRRFVDLIVPIFPGKGHDDWILKLLGPVTEVRFLTDKLVDYRIHGHNVNGRDITKRTLGYRWQRFLYKANRALRGHSKRAFYGCLLKRLDRSGMLPIYPRLVEIYRRHAKFF
jgi:glycosyltransferase involved in cell wall biosynthesis